MIKFIVLIHTLAISAMLCQGKQLFVGIMESDSYGGMELSISAFAGVTRLPELNQFLERQGKQLTALPEMKGFEPDKRIRIIQTVDPNEPLSEINPANIAIFTTRDGGQAIKKMLSITYQAETYWRSQISVYDKPLSTNAVPEVAFLQEGAYILTSRNKNALLWISQNKKLINAAPLQQSGTLKLLLNPQRAASVLNAKGDERILKIFKPTEILQELESCTAGITIDPQNLTITVEAKALAGSPLATLVKNLKESKSKQSDITPPNSLLQSTYNCESPDLWNRFAINLQNYVIPAFNNIPHKELFTGKRTQYFAPASKGKGLVFVQSDKIKNKDSVTKMMETLEEFSQIDAQIKLKLETAEDESKNTCYKIILNESNETNETTSVYYTAASLFLQHAWLEMRIVDDNLICVVGPKNSIDDVIISMNTPRDGISLLAEISARNQNLKSDILCGTKFRITEALRYMASFIPKITTEQLKILPKPGYGITFGINKANSEKLTASLQISADEYSALSRIGSDAQDLMQKLLVSMLMEHIEKTQTPSDSKVLQP